MTHQWVRVLLGFGSNLGDRAAMLSESQRLLTVAGDVRLVTVSRLIETTAWGVTVPQPNYLNAVGLFTTSLAPEQLLSRINAVEVSLGRTRHEQCGRWGPRPIDIDILFYDDVILETATLTIPHPLLHLRRFVLEVAVEVVPDWRHPLLGVTVETLWQQLLASESHS